MTLLLNLLGLKPKDKAQPTRAELVKCARQYVECCPCECDEATYIIRDEANGKTLTIRITRAEGKK